MAFFNAADGSYINAVDVGALPDMLTFTPDGTKVLVANEASQMRTIPMTQKVLSLKSMMAIA
ncbi:MAG: hypothetical protein HC930_12640 [Hydrococcus sp. SU_1_0]|nr:hypothetical protein [Hydrococcus sp. SU_1_0]